MVMIISITSSRKHTKTDTTLPDNPFLFEIGKISPLGGAKGCGWSGKSTHGAANPIQKLCHESREREHTGDAGTSSAKVPGHADDHHLRGTNGKMIATHHRQFDDRKDAQRPTNLNTGIEVAELDL